MALDDTRSQRGGDKSAATQMADEPVAFCQPCDLVHHQVEDPSSPRHDSRAVNTARKSLQQHTTTVELVDPPNIDVKTVEDFASCSCQVMLAAPCVCDVHFIISYEMCSGLRFIIS